jgi:hypothetical protein
MAVEAAKYKPHCGLVAVWDGISRGTRHMIEEACRCRIPVYAEFTPKVSLIGTDGEQTFVDNSFTSFAAAIESISRSRGWPIVTARQKTVFAKETDTVFFQFPDVSNFDTTGTILPVGRASDGRAVPATHGQSRRKPRGGTP